MFTPQSPICVTKMRAFIWLWQCVVAEKDCTRTLEKAGWL